MEVVYCWLVFNSTAGPVEIDYTLPGGPVCKATVWPRDTANIWMEEAAHNRASGLLPATASVRTGNKRPPASPVERAMPWPEGTEVVDVLVEFKPEEGITWANLK